jgi:hypothetical protein
VELEESLKEMNKRKKINKMDKKKIEVIDAPPLNWPWFEFLDNIFFNIVNIANVIDQCVHVMNVKTKVVNVSDEKDVGTLPMPNSTERQTIM